VLLTSVLPRAIETAGIIAPSLGGLGATEHCDLCEIHPGEADGIGWAEFEERYRPLGSLNSNPYRIYAPGSESWAVFFARVGQALMQVADEHQGQTVVIVCHGGVIEGSLAALGQVPLQRGFDVEVHNTSLTEWVLPAEPDRFGRAARWRMARFNDAAHLLE
jgi:probable phosphoglycerate mutase